MNTGEKIFTTLLFCLTVGFFLTIVAVEAWKAQNMSRQIEVQAEAVKAAERVMMKWVGR